MAKLKTIAIDMTKRGLDDMGRPLFVSDSLPLELDNKDRDERINLDLTGTRIRDNKGGFFSFEEDDSVSELPESEQTSSRAPTAVMTITATIAPSDFGESAESTSV